MHEDLQDTRRAVLKKTAAAAAATTGLAAGVGSAAARGGQTMKVYGFRNANGGEYRFQVNDKHLEDRGNNADYIQRGDSHTYVTGTVQSGEEHVYDFDGQATLVELSGTTGAEVGNPFGMNLGGELTVSGGDQDYYVKVTDEMTPKRKLESGDDVERGNVADGTLDSWDEDVYGARGTIRYVASDGGTGWVKVRHDL